MKFPPVLLAVPLLTSLPVFAVYAPIPEQDQGEAFTGTFSGGAYYDSNIFGASSGDIDSFVFNGTLDLDFNASVTDQMFVSAGYNISVDHVVDRPGETNLDNHVLFGRAAYSFSKSTVLDLSNTYSIISNPASSLNTVLVNVDQSYKSNQFDAGFTTVIVPKLTTKVKARLTDYNYDSAALSGLDRLEQLYGVEGAFALLPETKLVGEYRYQIIGYDTSGATNDKTSHFYLAGVDYSAGPRLLLSGRAGYEQRDREGAPDDDAPYVEVTGRYSLGERSFVSGGYSYSFEETSDIATYTDAQVHRIFANLQQELTDRIIGSASVSYAPSTLRLRSTGADVDENVFRGGLGLTYLSTENWSVRASLDYDKTDSDAGGRSYERFRTGVNAAWTF